MQKTNKIKLLALYVAGTLLLVSCGNNDNNDSILDTQVANTIDADNLPSLHILPTMSDEDGNPNSIMLASQEERLANWRLLQELAGVI